MTTRSTHAQAILGPELSGRLLDVRVLLVGAGGIGCELLKNLVLTGFGNITLLDLDTIDLSNLNRQFLFRKKDVKNSKAMVAAATAGAFNPNVKISPIHGNIKEPQFDVAWFESFDLVLNALDNLDARRHVNKMCMAANVPLVESGTAGYLGQVQPIVRDRTECFDCVPKSAPKSFPVCTIRSTPSQPIHCIVWAKSYLLPQIFGEDEDAAGQGELDKAELEGENAQEIAKLRQEQQAFKAVRDAVRDPQSANISARRAFDKVFNADIRNLLSMEDMWRSRAKPTPLDYDALVAGTFSLPNASSNVSTTAGPSRPKGSSATENKLSDAHGRTTAAGAKLKDQRLLTLSETLAMFIESMKRLAHRVQGGEETIAFDKDDPDTLDFVTAAANLRAAAYGIPAKSKWEVKEMAGNIIPAIATTNAVIAGLIVLQALHLLRRTYTALRMVHIQFKPSGPLAPINVCAPSPACGVCRDTYISVQCDPARVTTGELVRAVLQGSETGEREVSVYEGSRLLADPDWDDNLERTLASFDIVRGKFLTIVDEDDEWGTVAVAIRVFPDNYPADGPPIVLPSPVPTPPRRTKPIAPSVPVSSVTANAGTKRAAPDDLDEDGVELLDDPEPAEPAPKRARTDPAPSTPPKRSAAELGELVSPSKRRRLDEDGLVLLDGPGQVIEDVEVILVD